MCPGQICFLTGKQLIAVCGFGDQALGVGGGRGGEGAAKPPQLWAPLLWVLVLSAEGGAWWGGVHAPDERRVFEVGRRAYLFVSETSLLLSISKKCRNWGRGGGGKDSPEPDYLWEALVISTALITEIPSPAHWRQPGRASGMSHTRVPLVQDGPKWSKRRPLSHPEGPPRAGSPGPPRAPAPEGFPFKQ